MEKVKVIIFCVAVFLCFAACARQRANDPSDFDIKDLWICGQIAIMVEAI